MKPERVVSIKKIKEIVKREREKGRKIVFTNGCFDLIHAGHIYLLKRAKSLGDILIVGLNSDRSVKKIKGNDRPIYSEKERAFILSEIKPVDYVVLFNDETPLKLIEAIKPDVLVKGSDWELRNIVGSDIVKGHGGKVVRVPIFKNLSTTYILKKIRSGRPS